MAAAKDGLNGVVDKLPRTRRWACASTARRSRTARARARTPSCSRRSPTSTRTRCESGINQLKPLGNTPIAYSLQKAYRRPPVRRGRGASCWSPTARRTAAAIPCKVARELKKKGAEFYVDVVGLQLEGKARDQMTCIASCRGRHVLRRQGPRSSSRRRSPARRCERLAGTSPRHPRGGRHRRPRIRPRSTTASGSTRSATRARSSTSCPTRQGDNPRQRRPAAYRHVLRRARASAWRLTSSSGQQCGGDCVQHDRRLRRGQRTRSPSAQSVTLDDREKCGKGPYRLAVTSKQVRDVASLEVLVRTEPEVKNVDAMPPATSLVRR